MECGVASRCRGTQMRIYFIKINISDNHVTQFRTKRQSIFVMLRGCQCSEFRQMQSFSNIKFIGFRYLRCNNAVVKIS